MRAPRPYLSSFTSQNGRTRWQFRRGAFRVYFDEEPSDAEYAEALAGRKPKPRPRGELVRLERAMLPQSFAHAWHLVQASAEWKRSAESSRYQQTRVAETFLTSEVAPGVPAQWRDMPLPELRRRHVKAILAERAATPHQARHVLKFIRKLIGVALDEEWLEVDPTHRIRWAPATKGHRPWTLEERAAFERRWATGTTPRLVYALALWTGTRRADLCTLQWADIIDGRLVLEHGKTGADVTMRVLPPLKAELEATPRRGETILLTQAGVPFSDKALGMRMLSWTRAAGLAPGATLHGLRKTFAKMLADAGAPTKGLQGAMGHETLAQTELYTRQADRERATDAAMNLLARSLIKPVRRGT